MKTFRCCWPSGQLLVLWLAIWSYCPNISAQTSGSDLIPVVTIAATDPIATSASPGLFTVFRHGNTNLTLNVFYQISGTASNGVDYALISNWANIPAGATSNTITITPDKVSSAAVVKTVKLQLTPSPLMGPINYGIGVPSNAVVYIENNGATNLPPDVSIIAPKNGAIFYTPTNIQIIAKASDPDGFPTNVEFFAGTTDLGPGISVVLDPPGIGGVTGLVYLFNWLNVPPGKYPLTAVATDNGGATGISDAVNITVLPGPPTNLPPVVRMVSPANGSVFHTPVNIPLYAFAKDDDGSVDSVEFFAGTISLGFGQPIPTPVVAGSSVPGPVPPIYPTNLFFLIWSNPPTGTYALAAKATDNDGASTISDPVKIAALPSPPPPTNHPVVVNIVATDPVAIEGTNCWMWMGETNATPTWAAWPTAVCRCYTNYSPQTATFTVQHFGATNDAVTVPYDIAGTASNSEDYVALPGSVTIPAGERRALITIVPIDDGPPDVNKTVILTLLPDMQMNPLPGYVIGFPRRAAAIIIDGDGPRPATAVLPDKCFHLVATGPDAAWFRIQYSTDLINWTPVCTNQVVHGSIDFIDPDAAVSSSRFYRAVPLTDAPVD